MGEGGVEFNSAMKLKRRKKTVSSSNAKRGEESVSTGKQNDEQS